MNKRDSAERSSERTSPKLGKKTAGGAVLVLFLAGYSFAQPWLNERMGWNLPGLRQDSSGSIVADSKPAPRADQTTATPTKATSADSTATKPSQTDTKKPAAKESDQSPSKQQAPKKPAAKTTPPKPNPGESTIKRGPLAGRISPSKSDKSTSPRGPPQATDKDSDLHYGLLREIGRDRYLSPAGLLYGPGSAEGHRLEHLRRHVKDQPTRPVHGVFDGGMEGALKTIDLAYEKAKKNVRTTKQVDGRRTIYKVDMGKRIGFTGGRKGAQQRKPMARRVQLVLEGTQVITAYPTN